MATKYGLFLKDASGKTTQFAGPRAAKLRRELLAGRGDPEVTTLICNGYTGFLGPDGAVWDLCGLTAGHFHTC